MRKFKFLTVILSLMVFLGLFAGCNFTTGSKHVCESVCEVCGGCMDEECTKKACKEKCTCEEAPEHTCESVCPDCGGCMDAECEEAACENKCDCEEEPAPEHTCESVCPDCGGCTDAACEEAACENKCDCEEEPAPEHTCESVCPECGGGTGVDCEEAACADKCEGHSEEPAPEHTCESVCPECGGCTNADCEEEACQTKCDCEAEEPAPEHTCESVCEECGGCTNADCEEAACVDKCLGHHTCESVCETCGGCLDTECSEEACENKCPGHEVESPIASISVSGYKTKHMINTVLDVSTWNATATKENGDTVALTADDITIDKGTFDETVVGKYTITVYYKLNEDIYTTFDINVTDKSIKVLMIGNSFSDDTSDLAPQILDELGYIYEIGNMFEMGCSIDDHYNYAQTDNKVYQFRYYENGAWTSMYTGKHVTLEYGVSFLDWDIITFQQASGSSGLPDTYGNLGNLMDYVKGKATNEDVQFMFNMTWAYAAKSTHSPFQNYNNDQMTMYNAIIETTQSVAIGQYNLPVIPCGTAIQNARTSSTFGGSLESLLTRDTYHLTKTSNGRYIAALTFVSFITGEDISNITYKPKNVNTTKKKDTCIESAVNALANPFVITQSAY